ncbi:unnamed protein product [Schistocephalus solidus]|uniref:Uncharacterized protein n=1 Tax=Schistocephalus solidus TaxID=70667 RepID=A0A183SRR5_SCHSO|nr:unnamed protein product [Schistocephalus solidus]
MWWHAQGRTRPRQPPAPSPISGLLDSVLAPGSGGGGGESAVAAAQGYYHFKLIHAQVTVPASPFHGAYGGHRRTTTVELSCMYVQHWRCDRVNLLAELNGAMACFTLDLELYNPRQFFFRSE